MLNVHLKQRTFKSQRFHPNMKQFPRRSGPCRKWSDEAMQKAMTAVEREGASLRQASEMFAIPRSTLHDHVSGRIEHGALPGPNPYLTKEEEKELVSFLVQSAGIGYPHTRYQIMAIVQEMLEGKGIQACISDGWWQRFRQRNPEITLRVAAPLSFARAMATDRDTLNSYYDLLEDTLKENGIYNNASRIFNCDETGMPLNPPSPKVVHKVGAKNPCYLTGGSKTQVSVLACASAAGYAIPPFVIFDRKTLNPQLTKGEVSGTSYGLSQNGWIDRTLFCDWMFEHFLAFAPPARPLLLLLDGHSSHYCPEVIKACAEEEVIIMALPPNTTHIIQPLDRGCFSPLKSQWKRVIQSYVSKNHKAITRYEFSSLFAEAWYSSMTAKNIQAGFKISGVFPFNRHPFELPEEKYKSEEVVKKSKLRYIPLYSPALHHSRNSTKDSDCSSDETTNETSYAEASHTSRRRSFSESSLCDASFDNPSCKSRPLTPDSNKCMMPVKRVSRQKKYLITPTPPRKSNMSGARPKPSGRVLTSTKSIQLIEEKEKEAGKNPRKRNKETFKRRKEKEQESWYKI